MGQSKSTEWPWPTLASPFLSLFVRAMQYSWPYNKFRHLHSRRKKNITHTYTQRNKNKPHNKVLKQQPLKACKKMMALGLMVRLRKRRKKIWWKRKPEGQVWGGKSGKWTCKFTGIKHTHIRSGNIDAAGYLTHLLCMSTHSFLFMFQLSLPSLWYDRSNLPLLISFLHLSSIPILIIHFLTFTLSPLLGSDRSDFLSLPFWPFPLPPLFIAEHYIFNCVSRCAVMDVTRYMLYVVCFSDFSHYNMLFK